jgi:hypothetical protein
MSVAATALFMVCVAGAISGLVSVRNSLSAATTFTDDFEGSFDGHWEVVQGSGTVKIVNGKLVLSAASNTPYMAVRPVDKNGDPLVFDDVSVTTQLTTSATNDDGGFQLGIYTRANFELVEPSIFGTPTGYGGIIDSENGGGISAVEGSMFRWLAADIVGFNISGPIDLRFESVGSAHTLSVAANNQMFGRSASSAANPSGEIGLLVWGTAEFDHITVTAIPEPHTASLSLMAILIVALFRWRSQIQKRDGSATFR